MKYMLKIMSVIKNFLTRLLISTTAFDLPDHKIPGLKILDFDEDIS